MKKILLFIVAFLAMSFMASGGPATRNPIRMTQPDGSTITLRLHGDEYYSWYTSEDGKTVYERGEDRWWRPAKKKLTRNVTLGAHMGYWGENGYGFGNRHIPVLLVEFSDLSFQEGAADYWTRALNQQGFSDNQQYGSVRDYYIDASYGQFTPEFDVFGPIKLERSHLDHISGDSYKHFYLAATMIQEAMEQLDPTVDFSIYDYDNDGVIDTVCMIFAGMGQADGGGPDTIWPHKWDIRNYYTLPKKSFDGKAAGIYCCQGELKIEDWLYSFADIGTFCHEFGHTIGLPDLYDVGGSDDGGEAITPSFWSLMASGSNLKIPPRMSLFERYLMGYIKELEPLGTQGTQIIPSIDAGKAYILPASSKDEYFLFEVRNNTGWNKMLPSGMLIYHVDASKNKVHDTTAADIWNLNGINSYGDHPCYYILSPTDWGRGSWSYWTFPTTSFMPGSYNVTEYTLTDWSGLALFGLGDIQYDSALDQASFTVSVQGQYIAGFVTGPDGKPCRDASVFLSSGSTTKAAGFRGQSLSIKAAQQEAIAQTTTDATGRFSIQVDNTFPEDLIVSVYAKDCIPARSEVKGHSASLEINLESVYIEPAPSSFKKGTGKLEQVWGFGAGASYTVAQKFSANDLKDIAGKLLTRMRFAYYPPCDELWVFADIGKNKRAMVQKLENTSDVIHEVVLSKPLVIPQGEDIYIGYMIKNAHADYPVITDSGPYMSGGFLLYDQFSTTTPGGEKWSEPIYDWGVECGNVAITYVVEDYVQIDPRATLADFGISYIEVPSGQIHAGDIIPLKLVKSPTGEIDRLQWYVDGESVDGDSVQLSAGEHIIRVQILYRNYTGSGLESDTVELSITVN